jgi:hypothetical protein
LSLQVVARLAVGLVAASATLGFADRAAAETWPLSLGAGVAIGGGARTPPGDERGGLFELAPRAELLFGEDVAFGPSFELRTVNFRTAEAYLGLMAAFSDGNFGGILNADVGYAGRDGEPNGTVLGGTAGFGFVKVKHGGAAATVIYLSFHHAATGPSRDEVTAGVSFGGGFLAVLSGDHG